MALQVHVLAPEQEREELTALCMLQNHTSPSEVGIIFNQLKPRLAIATHLSLSSYSVLPVISAIRATYPVGPLAVARDFSAWDVTPETVVQRQVMLHLPCMHAGQASLPLLQCDVQHYDNS